MSYFPLIVLNRALKEAKQQRDRVFADSFPLLPLEELIKIDFVIDQLETRIRDIKRVTRADISGEDMVNMYKMYAKGVHIDVITEKYGIGNAAVYNYLKKYRKLKSKYKEE